MGLSNSPATFQRLKDMVRRGLTWDSVLVYIDDIVVYAHTYDDLKLRLEEVFIRLRGANLKLKPTKVKLFQREIQSYGPFIWTAERNKAYETLNEHLITDPILAMSQDVGAYTLDVDASN